MDSYDPSTGRFLNRSAKPQQTNPYVPWSGDPAGMFVAPLSFLGLLLGKKKKRSKWEMAVVILVLGLSLGMSLTACNQAQITQFSTDEYDVKVITTPTSTGEVAFSATVSTNLHAGAGVPVTNPLVNVHCSGTLTPTSIEDQLKNIYKVKLTGDWPTDYLEYILDAVKKVDQRFSEEMGLPLTTAFSAVYGEGYGLNWGCSICSGFAITYFDHIDFKEFFAAWWDLAHPESNVHFVIHELGHAFDYRVCGLSGQCENVEEANKGKIRTKLSSDIENRAEYPYLKRNDYGDLENTPIYNGFAGPRNVWQFSLPTQVHYVAEIWADMFLGWVYKNMGTDRQNYMNLEMKNYLNLFN